MGTPDSITDLSAAGLALFIGTFRGKSGREQAIAGREGREDDGEVNVCAWF